MKMKTSIIFACLLGASFAVPVYHQRYGLSASNSNEFMRHSGNAYNGVGYGQPQVPYMPPYVYQQQQPDMGLPSQLPLNPQVAGGAGQGPMQPQGPLPPQVLLPPQSPLPPQVLFPPSQKDQSPNAPQQPQQPNQMLPSYYPSVVFPQQTGGQGMPYYISYGYPQPNQPAVWQPTQEQAQQHLEQPTQTSQQPMQESTAKQPPVIGTETVLPTTAPGQLEGNINSATQPGLAFPFEP
ncbi:calcium-binding protein P-like [Acipenser ruthenus]|uniref:calcium-binding protein P-like n=1 Tax=Acipenser ruthenus TaxID=7906 RepID=UPI002740BC87|nr:calcium-binding protein P-like [Acipenser ruthenus]XP_058855138.1 calcium-binding protein P-like [Acipenser ruthenus]